MGKRGTMDMVAHQTPQNVGHWDLGHQINIWENYKNATQKLRNYKNAIGQN
jgi:hypothetical protein